MVINTLQGCLMSLQSRLLPISRPWHHEAASLAIAPANLLPLPPLHLRTRGCLFGCRSCQSAAFAPAPLFR